MSNTPLPPWDASQPLRADATDAQMCERVVHFWRTPVDMGVGTVAREFAAACVAARDAAVIEECARVCDEVRREAESEAEVLAEEEGNGAAIDRALFDASTAKELAADIRALKSDAPRREQPHD